MAAVSNTVPDALRLSLQECSPLPKETKWRKINSILQRYFANDIHDGMTLSSLLELIENDSSHLFDLLCSCLRNCSVTSLTVVLGLLSQFLQAGHMTSLLLDQSAAPVQCTTPFQDHLLHLTVTLPDVVANRLQQGVPPHLSPASVTRVAVCSMLQVLSGRDGAGTAAVLLGQLVGKLALRGQAGVAVRCVLSHIVPEEPADWLPLFPDVLRALPSSAVDSVLTELLLQTPVSLATDPPCLMWRLLGPVGVEREDFRHCLLHKNLLVRTHNSTIPLYNIGTYLLASSQGFTLLTDTLVTLATVWADPSVLRHTSTPQHLYVCRAVSFFCACCLEGEGSFDRQAVLQLVVRGVGEHLESTEDLLRAAGMAMAEALVGRLDPGHKNPLKFEETAGSNDERIALLKSLCLPLAQQEPVLSRAGKEQVFSRELSNVVSEGLSSKPSFSGPAQTTEEADSDDEFPPFAMPEETASKGPHYLRQCIQDLAQSKDAEKFEAALKRVGGLVKRNPLELNEVCVELARVLIHCGDDFAIEGFHECRLSALVAIATKSPQKVADYLGSQVYADHYSLRHRLDMLEVLTMAATELSSLPPSPAVVPGGGGEGALDQPRPGGKTRRFPSAKPVPGHPNRFAPVAGSFFFPLVNGFSSSPVHLQKDNLFLTKLLFSLGLLAAATTGTLVAERVALHLLEFVHLFTGDLYDSSVKEGVMFCCQMGVACLPSPAHHNPSTAPLLERIRHALDDQWAGLEAGLKIRMGRP